MHTLGRAHVIKVVLSHPPPIFTGIISTHVTVRSHEPGLTRVLETGKTLLRTGSMRSRSKFQS